MILVLMCLWAAILTPIGFKWLRDRSSELKINRFTDQHAVLAQRELSVLPAHRLSEEDEFASEGRVNRGVAGRGRVNPASAYSVRDRDERAYADVRFARTQSQERRRRAVLTLASTTALSTVASVAVSWTVVTTWCILSWLAFAAYLGLMFWAMNNASNAASGSSAVADVREIRPRRRPVAIDSDDEFDIRFEASRSASFARSRAPRAAAH
jgi:Flp pilus assembly protein TadB